MGRGWPSLRRAWAGSSACVARCVGWADWPSLAGRIFQQSAPPSSATRPEWSWKAGLTLMWCSRPGRRARKRSISAWSKLASPGTAAASRSRSSVGDCASQGLREGLFERRASLSFHMTRHEYPAGCAGRTPPVTRPSGSAMRSDNCGSRPGWRGSAIAFQRVGRICVQQGSTCHSWLARLAEADRSLERACALSFALKRRAKRHSLFWAVFCTRGLT